MRFMTYNIQVAASVANNPHRQIELFNLPGIADIIAAQNPDVVALQEVDCNRKRSGYVDEAKWLGERLGFHHAFAPAYSETEVNGEVGYYGNALLSRYPIADFQVVNLWHRTEIFPGEPHWVIEPRCCFVAKLQTEVPTYVLGTHLSTTADQQQQQLPQLATLVQELQGNPLVLMGDFNAEHQVLQASPLAHLVTNLLQPNPVFTCPNGIKARKCIDHILTTTQWLTQAVWVVSERRGISDHNPVVADLALSF